MAWAEEGVFKLVREVGMVDSGVTHSMVDKIIMVEEEVRFNFRELCFTQS